MFGYVVMSRAHTARDLADAKGRLQQEADDAHPVIFAQRPQSFDTVESFEEQQIAPMVVGNSSSCAATHGMRV